MVWVYNLDFYLPTGGSGGGAVYDTYEQAVESRNFFVSVMDLSYDDIKKLVDSGSYPAIVDQYVGTLLWSKEPGSRGVGIGPIAEQ